MAKGKKLEARLVKAAAFLIAITNSMPVSGGSEDFESMISYCQSCINREEGRCLENDSTREYPSGICGNYEPKSMDLYNVTFGPRVEGVDLSSRLSRKGRVYTEVEARP